MRGSTVFTFANGDVSSTREDGEGSGLTFRHFSGRVYLLRLFRSWLVKLRKIGYFGLAASVYWLQQNGRTTVSVHQVHWL